MKATATVIHPRVLIQTPIPIPTHLTRIHQVKMIAEDADAAPVLVIETDVAVSCKGLCNSMKYIQQN